MIYLGIAAIRSRPQQMAIAAGVATGPGRKTILWQAFLSDVLNPKVALFFVAFVPQFVDPQGPHPGLQFFLLGILSNPTSRIRPRF